MKKKILSTILMVFMFSFMIGGTAFARTNPYADVLEKSYFSDDDAMYDYFINENPMLEKSWEEEQAEIDFIYATILQHPEVLESAVDFTEEYRWYPKKKYELDMEQEIVFSDQIDITKMYGIANGTCPRFPVGTIVRSKLEDDLPNITSDLYGYETIEIWGGKGEYDYAYIYKDVCKDLIDTYGVELAIIYANHHCLGSGYIMNF